MNTFAKLLLVAVPLTLLNLHKPPVSNGSEPTLPTIPKPNPDALQSIAERFALPVAVLEAVSFAESSHNPKAIAHNPSGDAKYGRARSSAYGLLQVRGLWAGSEICPEADEPTDLFTPSINVTCGARLLRYELNRHGNDLSLALAAYNGGPKCISNGRIVCPAAAKYSAKVLLLAKK
jgi:soluble lytic murein transglycosylase-like protein